MDAGSMAADRQIWVVVPRMAIPCPNFPHSVQSLGQHIQQESMRDKTFQYWTPRYRERVDLQGILDDARGAGPQ